MTVAVTPHLPVLLVDDEAHILNISKQILLRNGIAEVITLNDSREILSLLTRQHVAAILLDLFMPHQSGLELLPKIVRDFPEIPVIVMTAVDETETAVGCMRQGAFDYLVKPVESARLVSTIKKALELRSLNSELDSIKQYLFTDRLDHPAAFAGIVTANKKMRALFQYVEVIADSGQPILITGETGVGKELFAYAVHELSGCKGKFVAVNVAGLDDNMFSDTLFGHKKGAFTGADKNREGLVAMAANGTLFLDEIGDLNELSQIKLLRLLQEKEYYPVGADLPRKSETRIVLATNRDLQHLINIGKFRNDLYYRLCAHQLHVPPLRERPEDLPLLLEHFLEKSAISLQKKRPTPPVELVSLLATHQFPGNVRELEAMVFDAVARHSSGVLSMTSFRGAIGDDRPSVAVPQSGNGDECQLQAIFGHFPSLAEIEEHMIGEAMKIAKGNQGIAASMLGITRQTLNRRLKER
jgi:DNA-binding NtrC family response regulator